MKPIITSMRFSSAPARRQPQEGDVRTTKKYGRQVRVRDRHNGMMVMANGRPCYSWVALTAENIVTHKLERFNLEV